MQCPNCGGHMGLEDAYCPYCGTRNSMAEQHQSDMAHYRDEYERTQEQVLRNTSFMQRHGSWLVILVILLVALMVGFGLLANAWDIGYSIRERNVESGMEADSLVMEAYLEQGEYGKFLGYYDANDINLSHDNPYQGVRMAAGAYVGILQDVAALKDPNSYSFKPDRVSDTCYYLAENLNKIYTLEEEYSYYLDEYLPDSMRGYLEDIRDRTSAIAITYFGLTKDDIEKIPSLSKRKLAQMIEEGIKS